jgi:hypothetical protein
MLVLDESIGDMNLLVLRETLEETAAQPGGGGCFDWG